ncbi:MAG TPA: CDP-glycerol glycerophosphotransferase family protein [Candidatus Sabulitectum sp.]|nr:CDP-glycerol glycerophosphotransferase family protein [Candidatus Sabulitectum sp.]
MKLLFYVSKLYSIPVVLPVLKEALNRGIPSAFFVSGKVARNLPDQFSGVPVFMDLARASDWGPDYVLCPGNFVDFRLPGIKVELFHGIGIEKPSHYAIRHFFDIYLTSGPVVTSRFLELQGKYGYFRVFETGWPKMDHIMRYDASGVRRELGVEPDSRVVLYAPTHSRSMESAGMLLPVLTETPRPGEVWFCKPHEFMDQQAIRRLESSGIRMATGYDITPFLHMADVLVSDTSSVVYEFMALDKPVVTCRTMGRRDKGIDITAPGELRGAVDRCLNDPGEFSSMRREHMQMVNPRLDGTVSGKIIDLLETRPGPAGRKPLNLFRKGQIVWHSIFRKGYLR